MSSLYDILEIPTDASLADIKKAYKKLSMKYHPDRETGDEIKFKALKEAYEILSDEERRAKYDATGTTNNKQVDYNARLFQLFEAALIGVEDLTTTNILKICVRLLNGVIEEGNYEKKQSEKEIAKIEIFLERLSNKTGNSIIHDMYNNKLIALRQHISIIEEEIEHQKVLLEKLEEFDYSYIEDYMDERKFTTATAWAENWRIK